MAFQNRFEEIWSGKGLATGALEPDPHAPCAYAEGFGRDCDELFARLDAVKPSRVEESYVLGKAWLLDRYTDYLLGTPENHTNTAGRKKHRCIEDVLDDTAKAIRLRERTRKPSPLTALRSKLAKQPPPPTQQIQGFPLGEVEADEQPG